MVLIIKGHTHVCSHTHMHKVFKDINGVTIPLNIASNVFCENRTDARVHTLQRMKLVDDAAESMRAAVLLI